MPPGKFAVTSGGVAVLPVVVMLNVGVLPALLMDWIFQNCNCPPKRSVCFPKVYEALS